MSVSKRNMQMCLLFFAAETGETASVTSKWCAETATVSSKTHRRHGKNICELKRDKEKHGLIG